MAPRFLVVRETLLFGKPNPGLPTAQPQPYTRLILPGPNPNPNPDITQILILTPNLNPNPGNQIAKFGKNIDNNRASISIELRHSDV